MKESKFNTGTFLFSSGIYFSREQADPPMLLNKQLISSKVTLAGE
jgi:hypothetical protein